MTDSDLQVKSFSVLKSVLSSKRELNLGTLNIHSFIFLQISAKAL